MLRSILIHHFIENSARRFPENIAVIHGPRSADYSQINGCANRLARLLIDDGVRAGDRVVLLSENSIEYVICYFGILKTGAVAVPLSTDIMPDGLDGLLRELRPKMFIRSSKAEKIVRGLDPSRYGLARFFGMGTRAGTAGRNGGSGSLFEELEAHSDQDLGLTIDSRSCAAIIYTSGSAGRPKGVMLSHANIVSNTRAIIEYLDLTSSDIQMAVLPFFYVMGMSLLNTHVAAGGRLVINNRFPYTAAVLEEMAATGVTGFSGVPSTYAQLLFRSPLANYRDKLPALRYCSQAGGHMPRHIKLELLKILPRHTRLFVMYGATEASARLTYVPPEKLVSKIDSIGIPISGVRIRVLSPEGKELGPGEVGELVAGGDNIMLGYFRNEEATKDALAGRDYHTGDLGYSDEDGFLFLTGRKDDLMKVGGHRINPREIEDIIIESGFAAECLIFAVSDAQEYDRLVGLVVPVQENPETAKRILEYCHQSLPRHLVPGRLLIVGAIPKNSSGKPDRAKCMELFARTRTEGNG